MKIEKVFLALLIMALLAIACKKEEKSTMELLTQHSWIMVAATVDPGIPVYNDEEIIIGYTNDKFSQLEDCFMDNTITYFSDGTVKYDEGESKCEPDDPQTKIINWTFNSGETIITEDNGQGKTVSYNLQTLDESKLIFTYSEEFESINYNYTITWEPI